MDRQIGRGERDREGDGETETETETETEADSDRDRKSKGERESWECPRRHTSEWRGRHMHAYKQPCIETYRSCLRGRNDGMKEA